MDVAGFTSDPRLNGVNVSATPQQWNPNLSPVEAWMAKPGDKLVGIVTEVSARVSIYSDQPYPIVNVQVTAPGCTEEGGKEIPIGSERAFHAFRTVARNRLAELKPQPGEEIAVAHHGQQTPGDSKSAFRYRIVMRRAGGDEVDWDAMAAGADETTAFVEPDDEIPPAPDEVPF